MQRPHLLRNAAIFAGIGLWLFLLLSVGSFNSADWPSHQAWPHNSPSRNLCGQVGAFVSYHILLAIGQGVFPVLLFSGICLAVFLFQKRLTDVWFRVIGLALVCIAFAAAVHLLKPGSPGSFPEGHGGIVGIGASHFLQGHFSSIGSGLILALALLVGLLLAADDLIIRGAGMTAAAVATIRERSPRIRWRFASLPKLPALGRFVTRDAATRPEAPARPRPTPARFDDEEDEPIHPEVILRREAAQPAAPPSGQTIELAYDNDEPDPGQPAAQDKAHNDENEPQPSEAAEVPPADQQAVAPKTDIIVRLPSMVKPRNAPPPPPPPKELGEYHLPGWDCLADPEYGYAESQEAFVREQAAILEQALREFGIDATVTEIDTGPVITMYEISLAPGIKVSAIAALGNDLARALKAQSVRVVAPIPGKNTVGIEVPNLKKEKVRLKDLMSLAPEATRKMTIPLFLGKDASGEPLVTDLAAMPHCLIAGTTGSGKSVCINTVIMSIIYTQRPDTVKLILVDPKMVEMAPFRDIPHLMCPVINDTAKAASVLAWAVEKMDERYALLAEAGVRNLNGYNKLTREELIERFKPATPQEEAKIPKQLPSIVIIIDELADLMMTAGKEVEQFIVRLAQKSRAVGIHLILATQRPQANVVTGLIKSNMPSRIAFRVASKMDSRIVLDQNGADLLLGQGDMLFLPPGSSKPIRSQGTYIDDTEIRESVKLVRSLAEAQYEPELVQIGPAGGADADFEKDELFDDAVRVVLETRRGSVSLLQRRLTIGYSRASRLIEQMAALGIVGTYKGSQAREALMTLEEWEAMKAQEQADRDSGMTV